MPVERKLDLVTLEVIRNALPAISNEMSYVLQRTSYNMMIYEVGDYCCGLLDTEAMFVTAGGGWGDPLERDAEKVRLDAVEGYISEKAVRDEYGVMLSEDMTQIDWKGTARLREELRRQR